MVTFLYNPDRKPKDQLISEFVVRTRIYDEIMTDLESSAMQHPEQHYLLVGQRGAGKTTLLNRIKYGVEDSEKLKEKLIPVLFTEEQYHISQLSDIWESVAQYLEDYHGFDGLAESMEQMLGTNGFEEKCFGLLQTALQKRELSILLMIDNVGDILKKLEDLEVRRFREILQTAPEIRVIAGSPFFLESMLDYQQPFFEFFKVLRLDGLSSAEAKELLVKLGQLSGKEEEIRKIIQETPAKIETLVTLTGGVPRTIALMFNIFIEYNNEDTVKDLERILDAVTPLYKHRMDDLPTQQQKIFDAVAKNWDGISVKEISEKVRLESKIISAQLRQLEKNQVIEKRPTEKKNHLYFVKERFFNIWYLMRYGRKSDSRRVIWLVRFLETWCSSEELNNRALEFIGNLKNGKLSESLADFYASVYSQLPSLSLTAKIQIKRSLKPQQAREMISIEDDLIEHLRKLVEQKRFNKAIEFVQEYKEISVRIKNWIYNIIYQALHSNFELNFVKTLPERLENREGQSVDKIFSPSEVVLLAYVLYFFALADADAEVATGNATSSFILLVSTSIQSEEMSLTKLDLEIMVSLLMNFLARGWFESVGKLFDIIEQVASPKDVLKPVYYAWIKLTQGSQSTGYLRAGRELQEAIEEVLRRVGELKNEIHLTPNPESTNGK